MRAVIFLVLLLAHPPSAATCPLATVRPSGLATVLAGHDVRASATGDLVSFRSKLARDEDGMPTAYHRGLQDDRPDPGADHICVGGDVLEVRDGRLVNKYGPGGSIGDLKAAGGHARQCKRDYIALRDAGFPMCGTGALCMRWYGVAVRPRSCGFNRSKDMGCGTPILQKDAAGRDLDFYLTTNTLRRPGSRPDTLVQSDYADASRVPFIVLPGGVALPGGAKGGPGDYAAVLVGDRISFAVVGDSGPANKLGEASRALLGSFGRPVVEEGGAYTVLMPGSADLSARPWPLDAATIEQAGRAALARRLGGGEGDALASVRACAALGPTTSGTVPARRRG